MPADKCSRPSRSTSPRSGARITLFIDEPRIEGRRAPATSSSTSTVGRSPPPSQRAPASSAQSTTNPRPASCSTISAHRLDRAPGSDHRDDAAGHRRSAAGASEASSELERTTPTSSQRTVEPSARAWFTPFFTGPRPEHSCPRPLPWPTTTAPDLAVASVTQRLPAQASTDGISSFHLPALSTFISWEVRREARTDQSTGQLRSHVRQTAGARCRRASTPRRVHA